ncbi:MAG: metallophosphoesterase [Gemmatimonadota bacterium]
MIRTPSRPLMTLLAPALFLAGCLLRDPFTDSIPTPPDPEALPVLPSGPSLQVLAFGDWGTGEEGQRALAEVMAATHAESPPDFTLTLGDNFYPDGVLGPDDPMWESHFESVYTGPFWENMHFQAVLGNHDHHGNSDAQIEYSEISSRWDMPARYYSVEKEIPGGGSVLFLALDTEPIAKQTPGSEEQREWADSVLRRTSAHWVVVGGHHPVATGGWHKPEGTVKSTLLPLLGARVDVYLSGHNHSTELIETEVGTLQAVCGGGGGLDNPYRVKSTTGTLHSFTNGGWCFLRIWPEVLAVDVHDREGAVQFRYLIQR